MNAIVRPTSARAPAHGPDLGSYDRIVVAFSGGKDSIASLLTVLEAGVPPERIEVSHHDVDGAGPPFMDWPSTTEYCRAVARALGVPLYLSWKEGGFLREMLRDGTATATICFETADGTVGRAGGRVRPAPGCAFLQVSAGPTPPCWLGPTWPGARSATGGTNRCGFGQVPGRCPPAPWRRSRTELKQASVRGEEELPAGARAAQGSGRAPAGALALRAPG